MNGRSGAAEVAAELSLRGEPRASSRDSATFEAVFARHYPRVVNIIARVVADRSRAEQLAADVFWKLYRKRLFRPREGDIAAWLHRVAVRVGLDALRAESRRTRHEAAAAAELDRQAAKQDPLAGILATERRARVRATLAALKRREARLLLLRASGLSYQEIAAALNLNPRSVGRLLARAENAFERAHRGLHGSRD